MTSRFPAPWRIVEIAHGFAVEDAIGRQLGIFYGRDDPNTAGHTGFLMIDEARQLAVDFAKLPELLKLDFSSQRDGERGFSARTAIARAGAERKTHCKATRSPIGQPGAASENPSASSAPEQPSRAGLPRPVNVRPTDAERLGDCCGTDGPAPSYAHPDRVNGSGTPDIEDPHSRQKS